MPCPSTQITTANDIFEMTSPCLTHRKSLPHAQTQLCDHCSDVLFASILCLGESRKLHLIYKSKREMHQNETILLCTTLSFLPFFLATTYLL